ncbi:MAG: pyruvate kinase [Candidatus Margulisiibacteriota bacterium]
MKRTKIIATLGPATNNKENLKKILQEGVDVIRLNGSHYRSHENIKRDIDLIRETSQEIGRYTAIFFDLQGPKIRVGTFQKDGAVLETGQPFIIKADETLIGDENQCGLTTPEIISDLNEGEPVFIDDGNIRLFIESITDGAVHCRVTQGGKISNHKGVNLPLSSISVSAITEKDRQDITHAVNYGVDYIALSFVSNANDVNQLRAILKDQGADDIGIISKIERRSAVENVIEIIEVSDIIMVARGDLGVEVGLEKVPEIQKRTIRECNRLTTPVIVATQMLESMVTKPTATRAEVSDIANAIYDRCDSVMLSAETAVGDFPVEVVQSMRRICEASDKHLAELKKSKYSQVKRVFQIKSAATTFCKAADQISEEINADVMIAFTSSGNTALISSKLNPSIPIIAPTDSLRVVRKMALYRGVIPLLMKKKFTEIQSWGSMIQMALEDAKSSNYVQVGNLAIVTAGYPLGHPGGTNSIRMIEVQ